MDLWGIHIIWTIFTTFSETYFTEAILIFLFNIMVSYNRLISLWWVAINIPGTVIGVKAVALAQRAKIESNFILLDFSKVDSFWRKCWVQSTVHNVRNTNKQIMTAEGQSPTELFLNDDYSIKNSVLFIGLDGDGLHMMPYFIYETFYP